MKQILITALFLLSANIFAQPCEYAAYVNDSIGNYKMTNEYLMSEKNFGGTSSYIFYSLALTDGTPTLNLQQIQKSKDFIKANCFDRKSKLFLQLNNGKIITLFHTDSENCGTMIKDADGFDNRITSGTFLFLKGSFEELKKSPVSLMRIKYFSDTEDYVIKKEFVSEFNGKTYKPETYFIDNLYCIEN